MAKQMLFVIIWVATLQRRTSECWAVYTTRPQRVGHDRVYTHEMGDLTMYSWTEFPSVYHTHRRPQSIRISRFAIFECIQKQCFRLFKTIKIMVCISVAIFLKAFYKFFFQRPHNVWLYRMTSLSTRYTYKCVGVCGCVCVCVCVFATILRFRHWYCIRISWMNSAEVYSLNLLY